MCCGLAWPSRKPRRQDELAAPAPPAESAASESPLRLLSDLPLVLRGPATGRIYSFGAGEEEKVDPRDRDALLRTRLFVISA